MAVRYTTLSDLLNHLQDFAGSNLKPSQIRQRLTAVVSAYQHMSTLRPWRYYMKQDRLRVEAKYNTGSAAYNHSTLTVTLAGGTFPSWSNRATFVLEGGEYEIDKVVTATTATLLSTSNPGANVSATVDYAIHNDRFLLAQDAIGIDQLYSMIDRRELQWSDPKDFFQVRQREKQADMPAYYTLLGDVEDLGRLMLRIAPYPTDISFLDYTYKRVPRPLLVDSYSAGTITTNASTTVTGSSTSWTSAMEGSILRASYATAMVDQATGDSDPQWFEQAAMPFPFIYERRIVTVTNAGSLVVDSAIPALSGVRYEISDPIDVEKGAMFTAFLRCCEWQLGCILRLQDRKELQDQFDYAIQAAIVVDEGYNLRREIDPPPVEERARRENLPVSMGGK